VLRPVEELLEGADEAGEDVVLELIR
jgi:hypothetical protein